MPSRLGRARPGGVGRLGPRHRGDLVVGAVVAAALSLPQRWAATLTAFGGGILLAAVALELVPDADAGAGKGLTPWD